MLILFGSIERLLGQHLIHLKTNSRKPNNMSFLKELWVFLSVRKKLWMLPIIIVMVLLGGLLMLAKGSVLAPFIYTLF